MKLPPTLKDKFIERAVYAVVGAVLTAMGFLAVSIWKEIQPQIVNSVLPAVSKLNLLLACGVFAFTALVLGVFVIFLARSDPDKEKKKERTLYKHDSRMGIYRHEDPKEAPVC